MSWLFSRALVEASSAGISSDGGLSAPSSSTAMPQAFSWLAKTTGAFRRSRSGMTCEPLTDARGEAVLTWCLADSLARTSARRATAPGLAVPAPVSGERWRGSLAKYDRDSSSWRTPQCSLLGGLDVFSATWPRWGMMRNGECSGLATPVRRISENASGSWPTPRKANPMHAELTPILGLRNRGNLEEAVASKMFWPTPDTCAGGTGPSQETRKSPRLQDMVKWATPCARDGKEQTLSPSLAMTHADPSKSRQLPRQMSAESPELHGGRLSPMWVEWLMGWPIGWTDLRVSAMDRFRQWCASHGNG